MAKKNKTIIDKVKKHLDNSRTVLLTLVLLSVLIDIFLLSSSTDFITFSILISYVSLARYCRLTSKFTFIFCILLLFTMYGGYVISGPSPITEKNAVWLVLFLLVGIIQKWKE